jgi:signal transduction histidine kinase
MIYLIAFTALMPFHVISLQSEYLEAIAGESVLFFASLTFLFFLNSHEKQLQSKLRPLWPGVFIYLLYTFPIYIALFSRMTGIKIPDFLYSTYYHKYEQIGVGWLILVFSVSLFKRHQQLQKQVAIEAVAKEKLAKEQEVERSRLIAQQKIELEKQVTERTAELKQSIEELKTTQIQLIQSEKMASLGELTAGIAHEIQNPLNFVNNFSEVNKELISEMKNEIESGNLNEAKTIAANIEDNEEKIIFHGKRADAIVKSMLQHSRASSGKKELVDLNTLVDEYLRLAYHGLRAKDKTFNAAMQTDYDPSIGKINIVPQDIGRVVLNLITNAFYSVTEKAKLSASTYQALVVVSTKKVQDKVEIKIKDNGGGIPQKVLDKIFQPFFTTKPTGQGTGLGLSLSYDIIKGYGGELKVDTKEKEFAEFTIVLPL